MLSHELSNEAEQDLGDIYRYTVGNFGQAQADRYLGRLLDAVDDICRNPEIGTIVDVKLRPVIRRLVSDKHIVLYRITPNHIFIDRILHGSMDITDEHFRPFQ